MCQSDGPSINMKGESEKDGDRPKALVMERVSNPTFNGAFGNGDNTLMMTRLLAATRLANQISTLKVNLKHIAIP